MNGSFFRFQAQPDAQPDEERFKDAAVQTDAPNVAAPRNIAAWQAGSPFRFGLDPGNRPGLGRFLEDGS